MEQFWEPAVSRETIGSSLGISSFPVLRLRDRSRGMISRANSKAVSFDVIVIGGGHAGCETASAAARMGAKTALVTHRFETVGAMSCNPAIGGLGKGHLVREVDALDGLMGRVADAAGIQFRMLNRRKGPAVRGPRAQADRKLYAAAMQVAICATANLNVIEGEADELIVTDGRVTGVRLADGRELSAGAVVITTGTFLRGLIHLGERNWSAGRIGEAPAVGLSKSFERAGFTLGRLKTGTPPRLDGTSIDWSAVTMHAVSANADKNRTSVPVNPERRRESGCTTLIKIRLPTLQRTGKTRPIPHGPDVQLFAPRLCFCY